MLTQRFISNEKVSKNLFWFDLNNLISLSVVEFNYKTRLQNKLLLISFGKLWLNSLTMLPTYWKQYAMYTNAWDETFIVCW